MDQILSRSLAERRFHTILMTLFGMIALVLASVGVYGLFAHLITLKTPEIGVRLAIGAQRKDILKMVMTRSAALIATGIGTGVTEALFLTRDLRSQLYGVTPTDPISFISVLLILCTAAFAACYFPARHVMEIDPIVALRIWVSSP